jgi:hypothetical protein
MKKLALFAMLLGSTFIYGCENKPEKKDGKEGTTPAAGATEPKKDEGTATTPDKKDGETTTTPDKTPEPAK